jgi:hypothetical protein
MKKLFTIIALGFIFMVAGGLGRRGGSPEGTAVDFQVILSGPYSNANTFSVELITSEKEWDRVWRTAQGRFEPLPERPTVNFGSSSVIAAFMGERSSSGFKIEIDKIEKKGRTLRVHVKKYETPGMLTVMTQPFTLVRIPKSNFKLEVIEEIVQ